MREVKIVTLDFESTWDDDYSLSKMQTDAYVLDPRFEVIGLGVKDGTNPAHWFTDANVRAALDMIDWENTAVLCHNTLFDGFIISQVFKKRPKIWLDTLGMSRALYPYLPSHSLKAVAAYLGLGAKGTEVVDNKGMRRADFTPERLAAYGGYCMNDCDLTRRIYDALENRFPLLETFLLDLHIRMFTEPKFELDGPKLVAYREGIVKMKEGLLTGADSLEMAALRAQLGGGTMKDIIMSNPKFAEALKALGVDPPMKVSKATGKWGYAFAKTDQGLTELMDHPDSAVQALVAARLGVKTTIAETRAQKLVETADRGIGFPIYLNYWGAKCVPGDTEVLTEAGWVAIKTWDEKDAIAQVTPARDISFMPATKFVGPVTYKWMDIDAPYLRCAFTEGHTMPFLQHESFAWGTEQAGDIIERKSWYAPTSGVLTTHGTLAPAQMRVLAMVQADGSFYVGPGRSPRLRVFVKKTRKIQRAARLLTAANVPFKVSYPASAPGYALYVVRNADLPSWLGPHHKTFGAWLLDSTPEARVAFVEELRHWDGWSGNGSDYYSSTDAGNAEWVVTLCHLIGFSARISEKPPNRGRKVLYKVGIRRRGHCLVRQKHMSVQFIEEIPYCATTQTGFFLARSRGRIFITGNTTGRASGGNKINALNMPNRGKDRVIRESMKAPAGYRVVVGDSSNIELRTNLVMSGQTDLVQKIRDYDAQGHNAVSDLYCDFATDLFGKTVGKNDKLERTVGKLSELSLGYGAAAVTFQNMLRVQSQGQVDYELPECERIVRLYRRTHDKVTELWDHFGMQTLNQIARGDVMQPVDINGWLLTTPEGFGLPGHIGVVYHDLKRNGDGEWEYQQGRGRVKIYGGKGAENMSQHVARHIVMWQMARFARRYPCVLEAYDEIVSIVPESEAPQCAAYLLECLRTAPAWCRGLIPLNGEVGIGGDYASAKP